MATITVTPEQQIQRLRESLNDYLTEAEHRGVPSREIAEIVNRSIALYDLERRNERQELGPLSYHNCGQSCPDECPDADY